VRRIQVLYAVAAALGVVGLVLRIIPARAPAAPDAVRVVATVSPPTGRIESGGDVPLPAYDSIIAANIFSRTRTAPPRPGEVQDAQAKPKPTKPAAPTLTLLGTTIGPQGAVALINASNGSPGAELHHMGDTVAGALLVAITDSTVTLDRPKGQVVLHLQSSQHKKL
jgi:hypothetical protein